MSVEGIISTFVVPALENALINLQSSLAMGGGENVADMDTIARTCHDVLKRMPNQFNVDAALNKYPTCRTQSLNTVLLQEMCCYNSLIETIIGSLQSVLKALAGKVKTFNVILNYVLLK